MFTPIKTDEENLTMKAEPEYFCISSQSYFNTLNT